MGCTNVLRMLLLWLHSLGSTVRAQFWRALGATIGFGTRIGAGTILADPKKTIIGVQCRISRDCLLEATGGLTIGDHVGINRFAWFAGAGQIAIGDWVQIGPNVNLLSFSHSISSRATPIATQADHVGPITIHRDVWIGANVVVLPDTTIEEGVVVAANSVVSGRIPAFSIIGGSPARVLRQRDF